MNLEEYLKESKTVEVEEFITSKIKRFQESKEYIKMVEGEAYYKQENIEIMKRVKRIRLKNRTIDDPFEANHKIASGYMKRLIKQKLNFSINDFMSLTSDTQDIKRITNDLGRDFKKKLKEYGKEASKTGRASWLPYIKDEKFKYKLLKSTQTILEKDDDLILYAIVFDSEKAELFTPNSYTKFKKEDNKYIIDGDSVPNVVKKITVDNRIVKEEAGTWNRTPVTLSFNNSDKETDLQPIKRYIDVYDIVNSDFANNLDEFQDIYWILENFEGEGIEDFLEQVKLYKVLKVGEGGRAKPETIEIPVEARKVMLEITENNIYKDGFGFNSDKIGDGNITNVVIRSRYENLNMKANEFEEEMREGIYQLLDFLNKYYEITNQDKINPDEIEINFDRTLIVNDLEYSTLANESKGFLSEQTRLKNDPRVTDVEKEIERIEQDRAINPISVGDADDIENQ